MASSKSVNSSSGGSGVSNAFAIASMTFKDGLAFPVVRSERNEMDTPERSESSCLVMCSSSKSRSTFVKKMLLYKGHPLWPLKFLIDGSRFAKTFSDLSAI